jgi:hypothetical protein
VITWVDVCPFSASHPDNLQFISTGIAKYIHFFKR